MQLRFSVCPLTNRLTRENAACGLIPVLETKRLSEVESTCFLRSGKSVSYWAIPASFESVSVEICSFSVVHCRGGELSRLVVPLLCLRYHPRNFLNPHLEDEVAPERTFSSSSFLSGRSYPNVLSVLFLASLHENAVVSVPPASAVCAWYFLQPSWAHGQRVGVARLHTVFLCVGTRCVHVRSQSNQGRPQFRFLCTRPTCTHPLLRVWAVCGVVSSSVWQSPLFLQRYMRSYSHFMESLPNLHDCFQRLSTLGGGSPEYAAVSLPARQLMLTKRRQPLAEQVQHLVQRISQLTGHSTPLGGGFLRLSGVCCYSRCCRRYGRVSGCSSCRCRLRCCCCRWCSGWRRLRGAR